MNSRGISLIMWTAAVVAGGSSTRLIVAGDCVPHADASIGQPGMNNTVQGSSLAVHNGDLIAGGMFTSAGATSANRIARWDGISWQAIGSGFDSNWVRGLGEYQGDLVAMGLFATADGVPVNNIARWDGVAWQPFGSGTNGQVNAVIEYDGDLIVGGQFTEAGSVPVNYIARWDGTEWHPMGGGFTESFGEPSVQALTIYNGDLIAAGYFFRADGKFVHNIARWDGSSWHGLGNCPEWPPAGCGVDSLVVSLTQYNGDLIVGGSFNLAGGQSASRIAKWNGSSWSPFDGSAFNGTVRHLAVYNDDLIAVGSFTMIGTTEVNRIGRWNGTSWQGIGEGCPGSAADGCGADAVVFAVAAYDGNLVTGGNFVMAHGVPATRIASWTDCVEPLVPGDLNNDGAVDVSDLLILLGAWGPCPRGSACPADLSGNGSIDVSDLLMLLANWG